MTAGGRGAATAADFFHGGDYRFVPHRLTESPTF